MFLLRNKKNYVNYPQYPSSGAASHVSYIQSYILYSDLFYQRTENQLLFRNGSKMLMHVFSTHKYSLSKNGFDIRCPAC